MYCFGSSPKGTPLRGSSRRVRSGQAANGDVVVPIDASEPAVRRRNHGTFGTVDGRQVIGLVLGPRAHVAKQWMRVEDVEEARLGLVELRFGAVCDSYRDRIEA